LLLASRSFPFPDLTALSWPLFHREALFHQKSSQPLARNIPARDEIKQFRGPQFVKAILSRRGGNELVSGAATGAFRRMAEGF
jgi:hypothetical protein